ncbi:MAG: YHS domain-containing protein, partial [Planctomycetia bacterium]|nr:YHS domain-containing protein [Planctomycetia bacterium]
MADEFQGVADGGTIATAIDPVCGMKVDPQRAAGSYTHRGTTYYFCCEQCRQTFVRQSEAVFQI